MFDFAQILEISTDSEIDGIESENGICSKQDNYKVHKVLVTSWSVLVVVHVHDGFCFHTDCAVVAFARV